MTMRQVFFIAFLAGLAGSLQVGQAAEVNGAWANDAGVCSKVFTRRGDRVSFASDADMYGSGFIIDHGSIRGKMAHCAIKLRKQEGALVHIAAACSTDIAMQTVQFTIKIVDEDRIVRTFPGIPELDTSYFRCR